MAVMAKAKAEDVAEALRRGLAAGYMEGFAAAHPFYADELEMRHVPPSPADGMKSAADLRRSAPIELGAVKAAMPDVALAGEVSVEGDEAVMRGVMSGTLNGVAFRNPLELRYLVRGGQVVRHTSIYDPENIKALVPAIMAAFAKAGVKVG